MQLHFAMSSSATDLVIEVFLIFLKDALFWGGCFSVVFLVCCDTIFKRYTIGKGNLPLAMAVMNANDNEYSIEKN